MNEFPINSYLIIFSSSDTQALIIDPPPADATEVFYLIYLPSLIPRFRLIQKVQLQGILLSVRQQLPY